ncbi:hypothetical protein COCC4DRAFT_31697, partial [Bipolaris maydis ATCC 48331]
MCYNRWVDLVKSILLRLPSSINLIEKKRLRGRVHSKMIQLQIKLPAMSVVRIHHVGKQKI